MGDNSELMLWPAASAPSKSQELHPLHLSPVTPRKHNLPPTLLPHTHLPGSWVYNRGSSVGCLWFAPAGGAILRLPKKLPARCCRSRYQLPKDKLPALRVNATPSQATSISPGGVARHPLWLSTAPLCASGRKGLGHPQSLTQLLCKLPPPYYENTRLAHTPPFVPSFSLSVYTFLSLYHVSQYICACV